MSLNNKEIQLEDVIQIIKEKLNSGGTVTFTPHGTSMYPMLRNGEDVVVLKKPEGRLKYLDVAHYRDENIQLKKLMQKSIELLEDTLPKLVCIKERLISPDYNSYLDSVAVNVQKTVAVLRFPEFIMEEKKKEEESSNEKEKIDC